MTRAAAHVRDRGRVQGGRRVRTGFTLIEILVVVAIIALLISILLPSLQKAREQAKKTVCLANLKMIGTASVAYILNEKNMFPWGAKTWYYGGKKGDGGENCELCGWGGYNLSPNARPINRYAYNKTKFAENSELDIYRCPSDAGIRLNADVSGNPPGNPSRATGYKALGASYGRNSCWGYYVEQGEGLAWSSDPNSAYYKRIEYLKKNIIRIMQRKGASRFILVYEDPADWTLTSCNSLPGQVDNPSSLFRLMGWHGRANYHSMAFLDGHADNIFVDYTRNRNQFKVGSGTSTWVARQDWKEE